MSDTVEIGFNANDRIAVELPIVAKLQAAEDPEESCDAEGGAPLKGRLDSAVLAAADIRPDNPALCPLSGKSGQIRILAPDCTTGIHVRRKEPRDVLIDPFNADIGMSLFRTIGVSLHDAIRHELELVFPLTIRRFKWLGQ